MNDTQMTAYEIIGDFQSLYQCHLKCRKSKRHKPEVVKFEMGLAQNLTTLSQQLRSERYKMEGYYHFTIFEPKKREVYATRYKDRIVIRSLCDNVLEPIIGPRLIYDNMACQKGKGTHKSLDRMSGFLREFYKVHGTQGYVLKCDIHKYFASINHEVLMSKLSKVIYDKQVMDLIKHYMERYEAAKGSGRGIPLGNQSSQWYGIFYLDSLDRMIKEKLGIKYYIRYMDDFILIHEDKKYLNSCLKLIREHIETDLKMELNNKTQIYKLKQGFEFSGWKFHLTETGKVVRRVKKQTKVRIKRRYHSLMKDYAEGKLDLEEINPTLMSYDGHLSHGETYYFKKYLSEHTVFRRDDTKD